MSFMKRRRNSQDNLIRALERRVLTGDLTAVRVLARAYERRDTKDPVDDIVDQINALKEAGLLTVNARRSIKNNVSPVFTDVGAVNAAHDEWHRDGEIEVDPNAEISVGDADGVYVQAWVWVGLDHETVQRIRDREGET